MYFLSKWVDKGGRGSKEVMPLLLLLRRVMMDGWLVGGGMDGGDGRVGEVKGWGMGDGEWLMVDGGTIF